MAPRARLLRLTLAAALCAAVALAADAAPQEEVTSAGLVADDECLAMGGEPGTCALNALQLRGQKANASTAGGECDEDRPCTGSAVCVTKADGTWSQCVQCHGKLYLEDCVKWDDGLRQAAVNQCQRTCPDSKCFTEDDCLGDYTCARTASGKWGQCIECTKDYFTYKCGAWKPDMKTAAAAHCAKKGHHYHCQGQETHRRRRRHNHHHR